jgi:hypothetical protein
VVWSGAGEGRLDRLEEPIVVQQAVQHGQRRLEAELQLRHQVERLHRVVAVAYHSLGASR